MSDWQYSASHRGSILSRQSHGTVETVSTFQSQTQVLEASLKFWIQNNLTINNIANLEENLRVYQPSTLPEVYNEFYDLYVIIAQVNSEMANVFDNYLCFQGTTDQNAFERLTGLVKERASDAIKRKQHTSSYVTWTLLNEAYRKIYTQYSLENAEIVKQEQNAAKQIAEKIVSSFAENIRPHINTLDISRVQKSMKEYLLGSFNRSFDYSGKLNNVANSTALQLVAQLDLNLIKQEKPMTTSTINPVPQVRDHSAVSSNGQVSKLLSKCQRSCLNYKRTIDAQVSGLSNHKQLIDLHNASLVTYTSGLNAEDKLFANWHMAYYIAHMSELFECSLFPSNQHNRVICMEFAKEGIRIGVRISHADSKVIQNSTQDIQENISHTVFRLKDNLSAVDYLMGFLLLPKKSKAKAKLNFVEGIKKLGQELEKLYGQTDKIVVVAPNWLTLEQSLVLREIFRTAKFKQVQFVRDMALAAYSFYNVNGLGNHLLVGVYIGIKGISVEIFFKNESNPITLQGVAVYEWDVDISDNKSFKGYCFQIFKRQRNPNKLMTLQTNPDGILADTYYKAISQIQKELAPLGKFCFLFCENKSAMWQTAYQTFLRQHSDQMGGLEALQEDFAFNSLLKVTKDHMKLRQIIADHPIRYEPIVQQDAVQEKENENYVKHDDSPREKLLKSCKHILVVIESGVPRLGVLTKRLLLETVREAEIVANDSSVGNPAINEQLVRLMAFAQQNKIEINI